MASDVERIGALRGEIRHYERNIETRVATLRQHEVPWSTIAECLGVTKQAAQQRYASTRTSLVDRPFSID